MFAKFSRKGVMISKPSDGGGRLTHSVSALLLVFVYFLLESA